MAKFAHAGGVQNLALVFSYPLPRISCAYWLPFLLFLYDSCLSVCLLHGGLPWNYSVISESIIVGTWQILNQPGLGVRSVVSLLVTVRLLCILLLLSIK